MKTKIVVDQQGISFGDNCWVSHEAIMGSGPIVEKQYKSWFSSLPFKHGRCSLDTIDVVKGFNFGNRASCGDCESNHEQQKHILENDSTESKQTK